MTVVCEGSLTLIDQSDARPITAFIGANKSLQQIVEVAESVSTYTPNWSTSPLTLTASVYSGNTSDITTTSAASNMKWWSSVAGSQNAPIATGRTYSITSNLSLSTPTVTYYFACDVYNSVTLLTTTVVCSTTVSVTTKGQNAVWLTVRGNTNLPPAASGTKNATAITATLFRAGAADESGITYQWWADNGTDQIDAARAGVAADFGLVSTAAWPTMPSAGVGSIGSGIPAAGAWTSLNTLVVHEDAIQSNAVFTVKAKDASGATYITSFTLTDVDDPFSSQLVSSQGDKLVNGVGSTQLYCLMYKKGTKLTDLSTYSFTYTPYDKDGKRSAFVDIASIADVPAAGVGVDANTSGASASFTVDTNINLAVGDIVKLVTVAGVAKFFEVGTAVTGGKTFSIRTPVTNTWLSYGSPSTSEFVDGQLFLCVATRTKTGGVSSDTANAISITGDDIDTKMVVFCSTYRGSKMITGSQYTIIDANDGLSIASSPATLALPSKNGVDAILTGNSVKLSVKNKTTDETAGWKFYVKDLFSGTTYHDSSNATVRSGMGKTSGALSSNVIIFDTLPSGASTTVTLGAWKRGAVDLEYALQITLAGAGKGAAVSVPVYSASLSSPSTVLKSDETGVVESYANAVTNVTVFRGATDDTANWVFTRTAVSGVTSAMTDANTLAVTGLTVNSATITLTGTRTEQVNLITNSSVFSEWTQGNTTVANVSSIISPAGDKTTYRVYESATDTSVATARTVEVAGTNSAQMGGNLTASIYLKQGSRRYVLVRLVNAAGGYTQQYGVLVDLKNGEIINTIETGGAVVSFAEVEPVAGWWRVVFTGNVSGSTAKAYMRLSSSTDAGDTSVSGSNQYYFVWGAQIDAGGGAPFNPIAAPISLKYSIAKSNAGVNARTLVLSASSQVFKVGGDKVATPDVITFTAALQNVTGTPTFSVVAGSAVISASGNTATLDYDDMVTSSVTVKAVLGSLSDTITVVKVEAGNGSPAYTLVASNQAHTLPASSGGTVSSFAGASNTLTVYKDGVDDTANWDWTKTDTNVTSSLSGSTVTVTAMTASSTSGYVDIIGTRDDPINILPWDKAEDFTNWTAIRSSVVASSITDPIGGTGAYVIHEDTSLATSHYVRCSGLTFKANTAYTFSVFVKNWNRPSGTFRTGSNFLGGTATPYIYFDSSTGKITASGNVTASGIERSGSGWYRVWFTATCTTAITDGYVDLWTAIGNSGTVDGADMGFRMFGCQVTASTSLLPYTFVAPQLKTRFSISKSKAGVDGADGVNGQRGSRWFYVAITGTAYSTATATTTASVNGGPVMMDTVVEYNSSAGFSETRYWNGSAWIVVNTIIDGNLLVKGSVGADTFDGGKMNVGKYIASSNWNGVINSSGVITTPGTQGWIIVSGNGTTVPSTMEIDAANIRGTLTAAQIVAGAITTVKISDGAVTSDKLADNSVTLRKMLDGFNHSFTLTGSSGTQYTSASIGTYTYSGNTFTINGQLDIDIVLAATGGTELGVLGYSVEVDVKIKIGTAGFVGNVKFTQPATHQQYIDDLSLSTSFPISGARKSTDTTVKLVSGTTYNVYLVYIVKIVLNGGASTNNATQAMIAYPRAITSTGKLLLVELQK